MLVLLLPLLIAATPVAEEPVLTTQQETVVQGSVPVGAQRVAMMMITLTASCARDLPVSSLTVTHAGAGRAADIARLYAVEGMVRLSRSAVPSMRSGRATIRLGSFVVPRCGSRSFSILADIASDAAAGGEHRFALLSPSDVDVGSSDARVLLSPLAAADEPPVRPVGPSRGTISVAYLSIPLPVTYGDNRTIARFRLDVSGQQDQRVTAVTLTNEGRARNADLQHLYLSGSDGRALSNVLFALDADKARFVFDPPLDLGRGSQRILVLHANVRAGRRKTIEFLIQEPGDIEALVRTGRSSS